MIQYTASTVEIPIIFTNCIIILKHMYDTSEDTTTVENTDFDEDKTQLLTGTELLKYFTGNAQPVKQPLSRRRIDWLYYLKRYVI